MHWNGAGAECLLWERGTQWRRVMFPTAAHSSLHRALTEGESEWTGDLEELWVPSLWHQTLRSSFPSLSHHPTLSAHSPPLGLTFAQLRPSGQLHCIPCSTCRRDSRTVRMRHRRVSQSGVRPGANQIDSQWRPIPAGRTRYLRSPTYLAEMTMISPAGRFLTSPLRKIGQPRQAFPRGEEIIGHPQEELVKV